MSLVPAGCPTRAELHALIERVNAAAPFVDKDEISALLRDLGHAAANLIGGLADLHDAKVEGYENYPALDPADWHTVWTDAVFSVTTDSGVCTVKTGQQHFKHNASGTMLSTSRYRVACGDGDWVAGTDNKLLRAELDRYMNQFGPSLHLRAHESLGRLFR